MRVHPVAMSLAIATVSGIAVQNPAFAEEYRGTFAQQLACTPDVFRLCCHSDRGVLAAEYDTAQQ
jgi:hypothetical protein